MRVVLVSMTMFDYDRLSDLQLSCGDETINDRLTKNRIRSTTAKSLLYAVDGERLLEHASMGFAVIGTREELDLIACHATKLQLKQPAEPDATALYIYTAPIQYWRMASDFAAKVDKGHAVSLGQTVDFFRGVQREIRKLELW